MCCAISFFCLNIKFATYNKIDLEKCEVSGYIQKVTANYLVVTDVKISNKKLNCNISLYIEDDCVFKEGENISFSTKLYANKLVEDGQLHLSMLTYNTVYKAYLTNNEITVLDYTPKLSMKIKNYVYSAISKNYSSKNSAMVYAMLFGDKTFLNEFDVSNYNNLGIAHIFAVSGLHISILIGAISFLLKKLKANRKISFVIVMLFSLFYCYICGFSVSVVRATIMSLCLIYAQNIRKQPDSLNALCVSFIILTFLNPINFLLKGFQLSFLCVIGILCLQKPIYNLFKFLPAKVNNALSVSLSAMIGTMLVIISIYGKINFFAALFNVLLIPIFSVLFIVIFTFMLISCVLPFMNIINVLPNYFMQGYNILVELFANINSVINIKSFGSVCLILFILFILVIGNYCLLKKKSKIVVSAIILAMCALSAVYNLLPQNYYDNLLIGIRSTYDNCYILTTSSNNRLVVVNNLNSYSFNTLVSYFDRHNIYNIDAIIANKIDLSNAETQQISTLNCELIYFSENNYEYFLEYEKKNIANTQVSVTSYTAKKKCFIVSVGGENILFCFESLSLGEQEDIMRNYDNFKYIVCRNKNYVNFDAIKIVFSGEDETDVISSKQQKFFTLKI